jgi:hypothetical protein
MAVIICEQCSYPNPEGSTECAICAEPLVKRAPAAVAAVENVVPSCDNQVQTVQQSSNMVLANPDVEYFVMCPESSTKTVVSGPNITSYFCEGCQTEHFVDGMIWCVESRQLSGNVQQNVQQVAPKGDNLWLEEVNSHFRIDITKPGGTLGRYGDFGGEFFLSRGMHTVSGEHCLFRYEFNNWTLTHISRTNQTKYNGMIMSSNEPTLLEDGKMITLANTVSFIVRIG